MPRTQLAPLQNGRDRPVTLISPSILSADFAQLALECNQVLQQGADWLHIDVMDGHFVPNLTVGAPVVARLRKHTDAFFDCHLMVSNPKQWIQDFASAGADMYTFHLEAAASHPDSLSAEKADEGVVDVCKAVRAAGMHVGIALRPGTPAEYVIPYIDAGLVDMVLILTVEAGFGGQKFMEDKAPKLQVLRTRYPHLYLEVDGGIAPSTVDVVAKNGANVIVAGTAIFAAQDPAAVITELRQAVDTAAVCQQ